MNIFILDADPSKAARMMNDKHVVKMVLESAQIICTALSKHGVPVPYKPTHANHPCTVWAGVNYSNFAWLYMHMHALNAEYRHRFPGKPDHASYKAVQGLLGNAYSVLQRAGGMTPFAQCMPDIYRHSDTVTAYRSYYANEKMRGQKWTRRETPDLSAYRLPERVCQVFQDS